MRWDPADARAFRDRDWSLLERTAPVHDPRTSHRLAGALYEQVREAVPGWPTARDREADLESHVALCRLFARIHDARRRRHAR